MDTRELTEENKFELRLRFRTIGWRMWIARELMVLAIRLSGTVSDRLYRASIAIAESAVRVEEVRSK